MSGSATRAACSTCPFWMRGIRRYGAGGGWKITDAQGQPWDFGDCRHRSAVPEQTEDSTTWGRTHAEDWCAQHPDFSPLTSSQAQLEASAAL